MIDCRSNSGILDIKALGPLLADNGYQDRKAVDQKFNLKRRPKFGKSIAVRLLGTKRG
tara:strand:- start:234 stop:407 length:174 start_codon:yes stop_codon:yes gene_type:complete